MSLEQLLYQNRCIKSKACMEIYKNSCLKIQECFEGLISHPAMIILTIFFNVDTWPLDIQKKLCEAKKIKSIGTLFVSALSKNWENCDLEKAKLTINDITTRFALMNEIFPCPTLEMRLELNKIMYIDTRKMINDWMNGQCQQIDSVYSQIRPANIDFFIAECKECRSTGSNFLLLESFKGIGKMFRERSNQILRHQVGLSLKSNSDEENAIIMSTTLNILKVFSLFTMEEQIKALCGKFYLYIFMAVSCMTSC